MSTSLGRIVGVLAILATLSLATCGDGGGSSTTPPPLNPLSWNDVPEMAELDVGEAKKITLLLSSAAAATYSHSANNANVSIAAESPRTGVYELTLTGAEPGEATVSVTATAAGYRTATASFPVVVNLRPLSWDYIPREVVVNVGDQRTVRLRLSASVRPGLTLSWSNTNVAVTGTCGIGYCELTFAGIREGRTRIEVTATEEGYQEASGVINVEIQDRRPFNVFGVVSARGGPSSRVRDALVGIRLVGARELESVVRTDFRGRYRFNEDFEEDAYVVSVIPPANYERPEPALIERPRGQPDVEVNFEVRYDSITDSRFSRSFWNELAFNAHDCPRSTSCEFVNGDPVPGVEDRLLYILEEHPNFYIRTTDFSRSDVRKIRSVIPDAVRQLTGRSFFGRIEEGTSSRERSGWVSVEAEYDDDACGRAWVGRDPGRIYLDPECVSASVGRGLIAHEIGHALGFFHVDGSTYVMNNEVWTRRSTFSRAEQYHAQLAYEELFRRMPYFLGPRQSRQRPPVLVRCFERHIH